MPPDTTDAWRTPSTDALFDAMMRLESRDELQRFFAAAREDDPIAGFADVEPRAGALPPPRTPSDPPPHIARPRRGRAIWEGWSGENTST